MTQAPRALILAAGRGERMRPLTDTVPKPLLPVRGRPLIVWHLEALARAGVREVVINTAWLEAQFPDALGDGHRWGLRITWSMEQRDHGGALETAGGIATALSHLAPDGDDPFWLVSGDVHAPGFEFPLREWQRMREGDDLARLWLVDNPPFHPTGDFRLDAQGRVQALPMPPDPPARDALTYANIALLRPGVVQGIRPGQRAPLGPCLRRAAAAGRVSGVRWAGAWENVGTPDQWRALQAAPPEAPPAS